MKIAWGPALLSCFAFFHLSLSVGWSGGNQCHPILLPAAQLLPLCLIKGGASSATHKPPGSVRLSLVLVPIPVPSFWWFCSLHLPLKLINCFPPGLLQILWAPFSVHVYQVLNRLLENFLFVKAEKCDCHADQVSFPGYIVCQGSLQADPVKPGRWRSGPTRRHVCWTTPFVHCWGNYFVWTVLQPSHLFADCEFSFPFCFLSKACLNLQLGSSFVLSYNNYTIVSMSLHEAVHTEITQEHIQTQNHKEAVVAAKTQPLRVKAASHLAGCLDSCQRRRHFL